MFVLKMLLATRALFVDRKGVTAIEYGLIAALIACAIIGAITATGGSLTTLFTTIKTALGTANTAAGG